ncbi:MAG: EAL domain-containing protein [Synechococcales cyanobacterium RM1_1_8]|nr:EAL domain-containing protein [Synechococcales cyanobacterium RM1_1_8]
MTHNSLTPLISQRLKLMLGLALLLGGSLALGGLFLDQSHQELLRDWVTRDGVAQAWASQCSERNCHGALALGQVELGPGELAPGELGPGKLAPGELAPGELGRAAQAFRHRLIVTGIAIFGLVWLGVYWLAGNWIERLHRFTQAVKRFEIDQDCQALRAFSQTPFPDEFTQLSYHFENTLAQLHQRERLMESSEAMYHLIFDLASIGMAVMDLNGRYLRVNTALSKTLGYSKEELLTLSQQEITYRADQAVSSALVKKLLDEGQPYAQVKKRYVARDGRTVHVLLKIALMYDSQQQPLSFLVQVVDLTRHKLTEQALQRAEERYQTLFETANEGIFQMTREGYYISANPALATMLGYDSPESLITTLTDVSKQLFVSPEQWQLFLTEMDEAGEVVDYKTQVHRRDGAVLWGSFTVHPVQDGSGNHLYFEGTVKDITDYQQAEERLMYSALYDALTGLPNRTQFTTQLQHCLTQAKEAGRDFTLMLLNLDRFKVINESLGPLLGDQLLVQFSDRLRSCLSSNDTLARLGGDEFAVLLDNTPSAEAALAVAKRIHKSLGSQFSLQNQDCFVNVSIGLAPCRDRDSQELYNSIEALLRDADVAMDRAKRCKTRSEVFDRNLHSYALDQLQMETDLRQALRHNQLQLMYQPIVSLPDGAIASFEALVRWNHPELGKISPTQFIPAAEESGLIVELGAWVLREACQQLRAWQRSGLAQPHLKMAVNVSGHQFTQADIVEQIQAVLQETDLDPACLRVEITEGVLIDDHGDALEQRLRDICDLGINLCIDDFGTGYSSLSRLHRFPVDVLKIDRSFVISSRAQEGHWGIIKTIVNLANELNMGAIAEGVETAEQLFQVQKTGCEYVQGYFFSGPLSAEDAAQSLERGDYQTMMATALADPRGFSEPAVPHTAVVVEQASLTS